MTNSRMVELPEGWQQMDLDNLHTRCCFNAPEFAVTYKSGKRYLICTNCIKDPMYSRNIKSKTTVGDAAGGK